MLEVATTVGEPADDAIALALTSKQKVAAGPLKRYLSALDGQVLGALRKDVVDSIQGVLPGSALDAIPTLIPNMVYASTNGALVRWIVESTKKQPGRTAVLMTENASEELAYSGTRSYARSSSRGMPASTMRSSSA